MSRLFEYRVRCAGCDTPEYVPAADDAGWQLPSDPEKSVFCDECLQTEWRERENHHFVRGGTMTRATCHRHGCHLRRFDGELVCPQCRAPGGGRR